MLRNALKLFLLLILVAHASSALAYNKKCLFINSYHTGYRWSDMIEYAFGQKLRGQCEVKWFRMDTKRNRSKQYGQEVALKAKELIDAWKPDVVVACDDNAQKYIVQPYYKNAEMPFIFCGVNYTVEAYGYPYKNVTGIIEMHTALQPMVDQTRHAVKDARKGIMIAENGVSSHKNYKTYKDVYKKAGIKLEFLPVDDFDRWMKAYQSAQSQYDFILFGAVAGVDNWDHNKAIEVINEKSKLFTIAENVASKDYAMLTLAKDPKEHGEWSAKAALRVLQGAKVSDIPIAESLAFESYINTQLLKKTGYRVSGAVARQAKRVHHKNIR